jgi:TonB family protein
MRKTTQILFSIVLVFILIGFSTDAYGQAMHKYRCKVAAELYSGFLKDGESLPPVYPEMWMINYPVNVYFAPDAEKLLNRDFNIDRVFKLGSYRIEKKVNDSIMFLYYKDSKNNDKGWEYDFRGHLLLGRQLTRVDNFIYREGKEMLPFTVELRVNPTVIYAFRPNAESNEIMFLFFSYTPHDNFPKSLLNEFSQEDEFEKLGYNPFSMKFPAPKTDPQIMYKAEAEYPAHLLRMKRSDTVKMMVLVDRDGTVVRAEIIEKALYTPFDVAAVDAAKKSLFEPAVDEDGGTVPGWAPFNVVFDASEYSQK